MMLAPVAVVESPPLRLTLTFVSGFVGEIEKFATMPTSTITSAEAVAVCPTSSVTVSVTVYVPAAA